MVRITETEITDVNGQVKKIRHVEAAHARIEWSDGKVEEFSDVNADEWPWPREDNSPEWRVAGIRIPIATLVGKGMSLLNGSKISLLSETGEIILKLGSISIVMQMSRDSGILLMGNEIPLDLDL